MKNLPATLVEARRQGSLPFSCEALQWLFGMTLKLARQNLKANGEQDSDKVLAWLHTMAREARREFGGLAPDVMDQFGFAQGRDLFRALDYLNALGAIHLDPHENEKAFADLGAWIHS